MRPGVIFAVHLMHLCSLHPAFLYSLPNEKAHSKRNFKLAPGVGSYNVIANNRISKKTVKDIYWNSTIAYLSYMLIV